MCRSANCAVALDTIELTSESYPESFTESTRETYHKRLKRKGETEEIMLQLIGLQSPMEEKYRDTLQCGVAVKKCKNTSSGRIKAQTMFCGNRWCNVCNNRKSSKMLKAYKPALELLQDPQLVTLTIPAVEVTYKAITEAIAEMNRSFTRAKDLLRKRGYKLTGIRKLEINYNTLKRTCNPHFHFIIDGYQEAKDLQDLWLTYFPEASILAQDIRKAKEGTLLEVFKYTSKQISKMETFNPQMVDTIYQALSGKRTIQTFGGFKKASVSSQNDIEDIDVTQEQLEAEEGNWEVIDVYYWKPSKLNWLNSRGEKLTYDLSEKERRRIDILKRQRLKRAS